MEGGRAVDRLLSAGNRFYFRDVTFVAGGGMVILSALKFFDMPPNEDTSGLYYALGVVFAYALGYAIQDVSTAFRIVRVKAGLDPNRLQRFLYHHFEKEPVPHCKVDREDYEEAKVWLYAHGKGSTPRQQDDHERIEALKQFGTVLGPCLIVSGLLICFTPQGAESTSIPVLLGVVLSVLGVILILLGWLKVTQQAQYLLSQFESAQKKSTQQL